MNTFTDGEMEEGDKSDYQRPATKAPVQLLTNPEIISAEDFEDDEDLAQTMEEGLTEAFAVEDMTADTMLNAFVDLVMGRVSELKMNWAKYDDFSQKEYLDSLTVDCSELINQAVEVIASGNMPGMVAMLENAQVKDGSHYLKLDPDEDSEIDLSALVGGIVKIVVIEPPKPDEPKADGWGKDE